MFVCLSVRLFAYLLYYLASQPSIYLFFRFLCLLLTQSLSNPLAERATCGVGWRYQVTASKRQSARGCRF